jgi:hypothetical protein
VAVYDQLAARGAFALDGGAIALTDIGQRIVRELGIDTAALASTRRPACRTCLDWSERRHHLAGTVGAALLKRFEELGWAKRLPESRVMAFSPAGERALRAWCQAVEQPVKHALHP